jgi:hypothetical protein
VCGKDIADDDDDVSITVRISVRAHTHLHVLIDDQFSSDDLWVNGWATHTHECMGKDGRTGAMC